MKTICDPRLRKSLFFFWEGLGFLMPVIVVLSFVATGTVLDYVDHNGSYAESNSAKIFAIFLASSILIVLGKWLNGKDGKMAIDDETGEMIIVKKEHSFWLIPLEYWGFIVAILFSIAFLSSLPE